MKISIVCLCMGFSLSVFAQEVIIKDNITGHDGAATNSLNNQTGPQRQVLLFPLEIEQTIEITRVRQLSDSTVVSPANGFSYAVREVQTPFQLISSGTANRINQTEYTAVTVAGNNTNLDEFTISGLTLGPGSYFFSVHSSDGNPYRSPASTVDDPELLLADSGGTPFLAGAQFHLYAQVFGRAQEFCFPIKTNSGTVSVVCL